MGDIDNAQVENALGKTMMRWIALALAGLLLLRPQPGNAEVIHRCEAAGGEIRYQQAPCSGSLKSIGVRQ